MTFRLAKESGMGVGLWLCKYLVERHQGTLFYAPSRRGGATFTIRFLVSVVQNHPVLA